VSIAPGRVNLIGEHTDYTGGFVLPVAINKYIVLAIGKSSDNKITGYSLDFDQEASCTPGNYDPNHPVHWFRYIMGVLSEFERSGYNPHGFTFTIGGNIPIGSGLSSSAAVEMACCTAMEQFIGFNLADKEAALLCQRAENRFVGVNCGIMDQYISRIGKKNHAILIDCTDLSTKAIHLSTHGFSWVVIDSKKRRGLVESEYNRRRQECEEGLLIARKKFNDRTIKGLRDLSVNDLNYLENSCDKTIFKRIRHIITENSRVIQTVDALQKGDVVTVGKNLYLSHASLRDDYEVSCKELDLLIDILSGVNGVVGARLTGAGFGGCVIALVMDKSLTSVIEEINKTYHPESIPKNESAEIWPIEISDGAKIIVP
jgi:galactokinase